jgi:hypothetical protein
MHILKATFAVPIKADFPIVVKSPGHAVRKRRGLHTSMPVFILQSLRGPFGALILRISRAWIITDDIAGEINYWSHFELVEN